jgi:AcrR family transcriptional regulator
MGLSRTVMTKKQIQRGVSKAEWLETALETLCEGSVAAITILSLAKKLGISRAGFYWHFEDRDDLLRQLLEYWVHEITEVITANKEILAQPPRERLVYAAELILKHQLARYEIGIQQWGLVDKGAAKALKKVRKMKMDFVESALLELGFSGDELQMRAMLFVCYHTWEVFTFGDMSRARRQELIDRRVDLISQH